MTVLDLAIRPFAAGDLPAMQQVRQAAFAPIFRSFRQIVGEAIFPVAFAEADAEQAQLLDNLCRDGSGHAVRVATLGGAVVGFVSFRIDAQKRTGEIGLNAVHPDHAGRGIGTALYEHAIARMKAGGAAVVEVSTGGDPSHAPARRAYAKAGFGPMIPSVTLYKRL
jgi:ribosomal protein S18 acetylase RimI-like enzyme